MHILALFPFITHFFSYANGRILKGFFLYIRDFILYVKAEHNEQSGFKARFRNSFPILTERYDSAGGIPRHYFWQDLWAARKVYDSKVNRHYDVGSRLDGFISHCLPFCEIVMLDIRPLNININNLSFIQVNCMDMSHIQNDTLQSFSSLHAVEHFGLGRYGDPIDPLGFKKAIIEIQRVVKYGGDIYFSVPVGIERLEFNAHRVFDIKTILNLFNQCELIEFSIIDDENSFHENADPRIFIDLQYGCGLFHFRKSNNQTSEVNH